MSNAILTAKCRDFYGMLLFVGDYVKPVEGSFKKMKTGYIKCIHQAKDQFNGFPRIDIADERGNIIAEEMCAIEYTKEVPITRSMI